MMKQIRLVLTSALAAFAVAGVAQAQPYDPSFGGHHAEGHDAEGWNIGRRIRWMQDRIVRGRDSGALDRHEFDRVQDELNGVRDEADRVRQEEGGRIDDRHRLDLEARLDHINDQIHWARDLGDRRPW